MKNQKKLERMRTNTTIATVMNLDMAREVKVDIIEIVDSSHGP